MLDHTDEHHLSQRAGWLRAAVLGANDGIVSIAGLVVGIAATGAPLTTVLASGVAGTVAGVLVAHSAIGLVQIMALCATVSALMAWTLFPARQAG